MLNAGCCGDNIYDYGIQACCLGIVVLSRGLSRPICCGSSIYDASNNTLICCSNTLRSSLGYASPSCCGGFSYDSSKYFCCNFSLKRTQC